MLFPGSVLLIHIVVNNNRYIWFKFVYFFCPVRKIIVPEKIPEECIVVTLHQFPVFFQGHVSGFQKTVESWFSPVFQPIPEIAAKRSMVGGLAAHKYNRALLLQHPF